MYNPLRVYGYREVSCNNKTRYISKAKMAQLLFFFMTYINKSIINVVDDQLLIMQESTK